MYNSLTTNTKFNNATLSLHFRLLFYLSSHGRLLRIYLLFYIMNSLIYHKETMRISLLGIAHMHNCEPKSDMLFEQGFHSNFQCTFLYNS